MKRIVGIGLLAIALVLLCGTSAPEAQADHCYSSYGHAADYSWEYWPGGYWRGYYYHPGWYRRHHAQAQHHDRHDRQTFSVSYDAEKAGIIAAIDRLAKVVERGQMNGAQALKAGDGLQVLKRNCASCHGAAVAGDKGDGFELFSDAGELVRLSGAGRQRILDRIEHKDAAKRMPPAKEPLALDDKVSVRAFMDLLAKSPAAKATTPKPP